MLVIVLTVMAMIKLLRSWLESELGRKNIGLGFWVMAIGPRL